MIAVSTVHCDNMAIYLVRYLSNGLFDKYVKVIAVIHLITCRVLRNTSKA